MLFIPELFYSYLQKTVHLRALPVESRQQKATQSKFACLNLPLSHHSTFYIIIIITSTSNLILEYANYCATCKGVV